MKYLTAIFLSVLMLAFLASCDEDTADVKPEENLGVGAQTVESVERVEEVVGGIAEEIPAKKSYPDNILMNPYGTSGYVLFNRDIDSNDIQTVTFLDTLANKPDDAWDVSQDKNGTVWAWVTDGVNLYIAGEGGVTADSCNRLFGGYRNLVSVDFGGCFYTDLIDRFTEMFVYCHKLETLDLSGWNTSNIRYMSDAFHDCFNLKTINFSGWDTSNVESMRCMFEGCGSLESVDLSHFDMSKVASFESMFNGCKSLVSIDASSWNTASAKTMADMFAGCKNLTAVGELNIPEGCVVEGMFEDTPLE